MTINVNTAVIGNSNFRDCILYPYFVQSIRYNISLYPSTVFVKRMHSALIAFISLSFVVKETGRAGIWWLHLSLS